MQRKKIVVMYYRKKRFAIDPFATLGAKRSVYYALFELGTASGFDMYLASDKDAYVGKLAFKNAIKYENGSFKFCERQITADVVYDRSGGLYFPTSEIDFKVLNNLEFKKLCADKMKTYDFIGDFMPESFSVYNQQDFQAALAKFKDDELVVLKPVNDFGGKGIEFGFPKDMRETVLELGVAYKLQRFVETASGIEGIVHGRHDLRIIIVNGKVIMAHVRQPKDGGYLANVAQGGSIREVSLERIPKTIMRTVESVQEKIDERFDKPIYSIDFGVMDGRPYIFELNDQIGFPREDMQSAGVFVQTLVDALAIRAER